MDLISSIRQMSSHLMRLEEGTFTDTALLDSDNKNLSKSLLDTNLDDYQLDHPTVCKFFRQLKHLIDISPTNARAFSQVLVILEQLIEHQRIRKHLQERGFVPLLANVLNFDVTTPNAAKVLKILAKLTKNLEIAWPEFYLMTLIPFLVDSIEPPESENAPMSHHCLSILVNICESRPGIDILLMLCSTKELIKKIQSYGFLSLKMHYLIDFSYKNTNSLTHTIFAIEQKIAEALVQDDATMCEDCFGFLRKIAGNALETCAEPFESKLWQLLDKLKALLNNETTNRDSILIHALKLFTTLMKSHESLTSFHKNLLSFAVGCFMRNPAVQMDALLLIQAIGERNIHIGNDDEENLRHIWTEIVKWLRKDTLAGKVFAALQVLNTFVYSVKHQQFILSAVSRPSLLAILELEADVNVEQLRDEKILLILAALNLIAAFEAVEPQDWYGCVDGVLKLPEMRAVIAQGFSRKNQDIFRCCLELSRHTNFPSKEISCSLYGATAAAAQNTTFHPEETNSPVRVLQKQSNQIDDLLRQFSASPTKDMSESTTAVFVEYQNIYSRAMDQYHRQQIDEGQKHIATLTNRNGVLQSERRYNKSLICQLKISSERLCNELNTCKEVIEKREKSLLQVTSKVEDLTRLNSDMKSQLKVLEDEKVQLHEEMDKYVADSNGKIKKLKKMIKQLEEEKLQEQKKNELSQKVIDHMKKEANERLARIQHLEDKFKETESIKQKMHNLMNGL